jgi:hypothetical protein
MEILRARGWPDRIVTGVGAKMKDKAFARTVDRGELRRGAELLEMPLVDLVALVIAAQVPIADRLGIGGGPAPELPDDPRPPEPPASSTG